MNLPQSAEYLDLLEKVLTFSLWPQPPAPITMLKGCSTKLNIACMIDKLLHRLTVPDTGGALSLCVDIDQQFAESSRANGVAWPSLSHTMVGRARLRNIRELCAAALEENTPGSFVECGVWRGGASIMARACLPSNREVVCCDSFQGLPPDTREPHWSKQEFLRVSKEQVEAYFRAFDLLENVRFVKGFFCDTLYDLDTGPIAVLRCDGDMYSSTWDILSALYSKVSPGGYVIVDDYGVVDTCREAVNNFRSLHRITDTIRPIDQSGVWWKKQADPVVRLSEKDVYGK